MQIWWKWLIVAVLAYLIGSINPAIIVCRKSMGCDIRKLGSGNAGSTNAFRTMGTKRALAVMTGDILKTMLAALVGQLIFGWMNLDAGAAGRLLGGLFAMVGHIFPVYYKFKGGKGVVATGITMLMFDLRLFLIAFSIFLITAFLTRYVSLGSILAVISLAILTTLFYPGKFFYIIAISITAALIIFMHRGNIVRLVKGTESKFYFKKKQLN